MNENINENTENDVQMTTTSEQTTAQEESDKVVNDGNKNAIGAVGVPAEVKDETEMKTKDDFDIKGVETIDGIDDLKGAGAKGIVNNAETKGVNDSSDLEIKDEIDNLQDTAEERIDESKKDKLGNNEEDGAKDEAGTNDLNEPVGEGSLGNITAKDGKEGSDTKPAANGETGQRDEPAGEGSLGNITAGSNDTEDGQEDSDAIPAANGETGQRVPLFEQPIERDGPRSRRQAEPFQSDIGTPKRKQFTPEKVAKGQGIKLKNIGWISDHIQLFNFKQNHIKNLHHVLFGRTGEEKYRISNILEFSGYPFLNDRSKIVKFQKELESFSLYDLKIMFDIINFNVTGQKKELCARIMEFLGNPTDNEIYKQPDAEKRGGRRLSARNGKPSKRKHSDSFVSETEPRVTRSRLTRSFPSDKGGYTSTSTVETEEVFENSNIAVGAEIPLNENDQSAATENTEGEDNVEGTPEPAADTPEPAVATPEPAEATPEPAEATPEPAKATPEPVKATPEPVKATPEHVEATPEPMEATPEPIEATPEPMEATPEPMEATPEPMEASSVTEPSSFDEGDRVNE